MAQQRINVQAPIERLFAKRWSTRAFDAAKPVSAEQVASCLEAARWAPSCFGAEPWQYLVVDRFYDAASWQLVLDALAPKNQLWAAHAPVLIVTTTDPIFPHNGKTNRWAEYDAGQATQCLCLQAESLGLASHQMGGFDSAALSSALAIPENLQIMSVTALGYVADLATIDADFQPMEAASRTRKPLSEIVHNGRWGTTYSPPAAAGWEARYQETSAEQLPWFYPELDADFARTLTDRSLNRGTALDLGCGPGTQAVALAKMGFSVTASDVSSSAVASARVLAEQEQVDIHCTVDNVLDSQLHGSFDLIIDRGVFHCFPNPNDQQAYLNSMAQLLAPDGLLLLKCFHKDETSEMGPPCRYNEADIHRFFANGFELIESRDSYFGSPDCEESPKALFSILRKA
ncbi:methyltransferase domain-containing protein [Mariprofundus sp. EBB-1]|uniref:nitroreductase family protein n=1 Tax=Mariprofundus sp. EBB-1 TaxID=2650971 RepID=UPI000EF28246|nr:nitroreductase family protein [Mariprofundus sp. EBB-1]RLL51580.1 methyltransferase domain-containing protein [Mariprofundus sp. EBB-1]